MFVIKRRPQLRTTLQSAQKPPENRSAHRPPSRGVPAFVFSPTSNVKIDECGA